MKVGIICAGDQELAPFLPWIEPCAVTEKAMLRFYSGAIEGVEATALFCGVCKTNAAIAAQILIDTYQCEALINAGTAGGMDPRVKVLDTVISTQSAYWDVEEGILTEFHPWASSVFWQADEALLALAKKTVRDNDIPNVHFGRMVTGESFIEDAHRREILERFSPLSVDMETASIAHVCYVNRIPYLAVRAVTDTAEHAGTEAFERNCQAASQRAADVVRLLLRELRAAAAV